MKAVKCAFFEIRCKQRCAFANNIHVQRNGGCLCKRSLNNAQDSCVSL